MRNGRELSVSKNQRTSAIFVGILLLIVSGLMILHSYVKGHQDEQAQKCIHNQTVPVQEYNSTNIICLNKSTIKEPFEVGVPQ